MKPHCLVAAGTALLATLSAQAQFSISISPLSTFGKNGWLAPNGYNGSTYQYLAATGETERGLAFGNNHLYLVSRNGGNSVRILDPLTGADLGALNLGTGIIGGGTFDINMAAVGGDGAIYVANLANPANTTTHFRVYRWANDLSSTTPTLAYDNVPLSGGRVGDSLAAIGSGSSTRLVAGFNDSLTVPGNNGYAVIDPAAGTATAISFSGGTVPSAGDFRLGISFTDASHVIGSQGGTLRYTSYSGSAGTLLASPTLASSTERIVSFATVGGHSLMAALSTGDNRHVSIYDMSDPTHPALLAQTNATVGTVPADLRNTGEIAWGNISGDTAQIFALATDGGIQAFNLVVPEPGALAFASLGVVVLACRRKFRNGKGSRF